MREVDEAHAHDARARRQHLANVFGVESEPAAVLDEPDLHAAVGQVQPGKHAGRMIELVQHHLVAVAPGKPFGHDADSMAGAAHEGDMRRICVQQRGRLRAHGVDAFVADREQVVQPFGGHALEEGGDGAHVACGRRPERGVVEVDAAPRDWKFLAADRLDVDHARRTSATVACASATTTPSCSTIAAQ